MTYTIIIPVAQNSTEIEHILESLYPSLDMVTFAEVSRSDDIRYRKDRATSITDNEYFHIPVTVEHGDSYIDGYCLSKYLHVRILKGNPIIPELANVPCTQIKIDDMDPNYIRILDKYLEKVGGWLLKKDIAEMFLKEDSYCISEERHLNVIGAYGSELRSIQRTFGIDVDIGEPGIERMVAEFSNYLKLNEDKIKCFVTIR